MIRQLGVEIADHKTHISNSFIEFAKRYFIPTGEISPVSYKGYTEASKSYMAFIDFTHILYDRGLRSPYSALTVARGRYSDLSKMKKK